MRDVAVFVIGIVHLAGHAYHRHHTRRCQRGRFGVVGIGVLLGGHRRCAARPPPQRVIGVGDVLRAAASHAIDHILHLPVVAVSIGIPHRHRPRRRSVLRGGHLAGGGRIGIAHRGRKLRRGQRTARILPFLRQSSRQVIDIPRQFVGQRIRYRRRLPVCTVIIPQRLGLIAIIHLFYHSVQCIIGIGHILPVTVIPACEQARFRVIDALRQQPRPHLGLCHPAECIVFKRIICTVCNADAGQRIIGIGVACRHTARRHRLQDVVVGVIGI